MAKKIEEERTYYDPEDFDSQVKEFLRTKELLQDLEKKNKELRDKLMEKIDEDGLEDDKGNVLFEFEQPVDGCVRLEKQRRTSRKLDEEKAEELITKYSLEDDVYKYVRVVDEDALMASYYEDKITEEELDEMFPVVVTWALRTPKK